MREGKGGVYRQECICPINSTDMARRKNYRVYSKTAMTFFAILAIIVILVGILRIFMTSYPAFNITRVTMQGAGDLSLGFAKRLIGINIFSLNLTSLKEQIQEQAGDVECILIQRKLPSEIILYFLRRLPIAQLKLLRFYPVDQTATIISGPSDLVLEDLPVIIGLSEKIPKPKIGRTYALKELKLAIELIKAKNEDPGLINYRLNKIILDKPAEASFYIAENFPQSGPGKNITYNRPAQVEVKFTPQNLKGTMRVLGVILNKHRDYLGNIEYINLKNPDSPVFLERKRTGQ